MCGPESTRRLKAVSWTSGLLTYGRRTHGGPGFQDHVGYGLRLGNHDHVRAVDLGDGRAGPLRHRADEIGAGRLVARGDDAPRRQALPGQRPGPLGERHSATGRWVAAITAASSAGRSAAKASLKRAGSMANSTAGSPPFAAG